MIFRDIFSWAFRSAYLFVFILLALFLLKPVTAGLSNASTNPWGLSGSLTQSGVTLHWQPATSGNFSNPTGYWIFRSSSADGPFEQVGMVSIPTGANSSETLLYVDQPGPGSWYYQIEAFNLIPTAESAPSNEYELNVGTLEVPTPMPTPTFTPLPESANVIRSAQVSAVTNTPTLTPTITPTMIPYWPDGPRGGLMSEALITGGTGVCGANTALSLDLMVNCSEQGTQDRRWTFLIVNYGSSPLTVSSSNLSLGVWFFEPQLECTAMVGNNGEVYNSNGGSVGPMQLVGNAYSQDVSMAEYEESPTHIANQYGIIPLTYQSGVSVIPAGGWMQGFAIIGTSAASCNNVSSTWANFDEDYSGLPSTQTSCNGNEDGPYYEDHHFALYSNGGLVQEVLSNGSFDPQSGCPPGGGTCTPTVTLTNTKTSTITPTPTFTKTISPTFTKTYTVTPSNTFTPIPPTNTFTPVPPTNTFTYTPIPPTKTFTSTPIPPTNTFTFTPVPATNTFTYTPIPPTKTFTNTPIPATNTFTNTPVPPTNTFTFTPVPPTNTFTYTPIPPTKTFTNTPIPPTNTFTFTPVPPTNTFTNTPIPPTSTYTNTPVPPTNTFTYTPVPPTSTFTNTPVPPTNTFTNTPIPPTNTFTYTPIPLTNTFTNTPVPPTNTFTNTPIPPTNTLTNTPIPSTSTFTNTPIPPTNTFTNTPILPTGTFTNTPSFTVTSTPTLVSCFQLRNFFSLGSAPQGIAMDGSGNLYVSELNNSQIQVFTSNGGFLKAFNAGVPGGMTFGSNGYLYVAVPSQREVEIFDQNDNLHGTILGSNQGDLLSTQIRVGADSNGNIYVADYGNSNVQEFTSSGAFEKIVVSGVPYANGVAIDKNGNIYVSQAGNANQIEVFNSTGTLLRTIGSSGAGNGYLNGPSELKVDGSGDVYVTDANNNRVQVFDPTGRFIISYGINFLNNPLALVLDASNDVFVADNGNNRIVEYSPCGSTPTPNLSLTPTVTPTLTFTPTITFTPLDCSVTTIQDSSMNGPEAVGLDVSGNVYEVESIADQLQVFNSSGTSIAQWNGSSSGTAFNDPEGIAVNTAVSQIYVSDSGNGRVVVFSYSGNYLNQWSTSIDGQTSYPEQIAVPEDGYVYVADASAALVLKYQPITNGATLVNQFPGSGTGTLENPTGVALDSSGNIYVGDIGTNQVVVMNSSGGSVTTWGSSGSDAGKFINPEEISISPTNKVYVVDEGNARVQEFDTSGNFINQFTGQTSTQPAFGDPAGLYMKDDNHIYVADYGNNQIVVVGSCNGIATSTPTLTPTITLTGTITSTPIVSASCLGPPSVFGFPTVPGPIAVDTTTGNVYFSRSGSSQIEEWGSNGVSIRTWGSYGYGNNEFVNPYQMTFDDTAQELYVTDYSTGLVQVFDQNGNFKRSFSTGNAYAIGIVLDGLGNVFVSNYGSQVVEEFTTSGTLEKTIGSGYLDYPTGVAFGPDRYLYVLEPNLQRVSVFNPNLGSNGTLLTSWTNSQISNSYQLLFDQQGNLLEPDFNHDLIQVFNRSGGSVTSYGDNFSQSPHEIAFGSNGSLYATDYGNNRIVNFAPCGVSTITPTATIATNTPTVTPTSTSTATFTMTPSPTVTPNIVSKVCLQFAGSFQSPNSNYINGSALDSSGNLYLTQNDVEVLTTQGAPETEWGSANIQHPEGIVVGQAVSQIYVVDDGANQVETFDLNGNFKFHFSTLSDGGSLNDPTGIALDASGNVYVADSDNAQVAKFTSTGFPVTVFGSNTLNFPEGIAVDSSGNVFVGDGGAGNISKFAPNGSPVTSFNGNGVVEEPYEMKIDYQGLLWVADPANGLIEVFDANQNLLNQFNGTNIGGTAFDQVMVSVDSLGTVYVPDTFTVTVQKFSSCWANAPPTYTPTITFTPTITPTLAYPNTPTYTFTPTNTNSFTSTSTPTITNTITSTFTPTSTSTPTNTPILVVMATATGTLATGTPTLTPNLTSTATPTPTITSTTVPGAYVFRLNAAGEDYQDGRGNPWFADQDYVSGGGAGQVSDDDYYYTTDTIGMNPNLGTGPAPDQPLYNTFVEGSNIEYKFDVPPGNYQVTLKMVNTDYLSTGQASFSVLANGTTEIANLDSYLSGYYNAYDTTFNVTVTGTSLDLVWDGNSGSLATVSAIQVLGLQAAPTPTPAQTACENSNGSISGFYFPGGVGVDGQGNLYISSGDIKVFQPNGGYLYEFGSGFINGPTAIEMDNTNKLLYVTDSGDSQIVVFRQSGSAAMTIGNGILNNPGSSALDGNGNLFVADSGHNQVVEFNASTGVSINSFGVYSPQEQSLQPSSVAVQPSTGNIYVGIRNASESLNIYRPSGLYLGNWQSSFHFPAQLRFDSQGRLWESENSNNGRLNVFDANGNSLGSFPSPQSVSAGFDFIPGGGYAVAALYNVFEYSPCGQPTATPDLISKITATFTLTPTGTPLTNTPTPDATPTSTTTPTATLTQVPGAYVFRINAAGDAYTDGNGNSWIADQDYVPGGGAGQVSDDDYYYTTDTIGMNPSLGTGPAPNQPLYNTFVEGSNIEYKFDLAPGNYQVTLKMVNTDYLAPGNGAFSVLANGTTEISNEDSFLAGYYNAYDTSFNVAVTGTSLDLVWVASQGLATVSAIQVLGLQAAPTPTIIPTICEVPNPQGTISGGFYYPTGVGVDGNGNIYASSLGGDVKVFEPNGGYLFNFGSGLTSSPGQIEMDNVNQLLYVTDTGNNQIVVFHQSGSAAATIGNGILVGPGASALDGKGNLYVADYSQYTGESRVVEFNASSGVSINAFGSSGTYLGNMNDPTAVAIEPSTGNIFVANRSGGLMNVYNSNGSYLRNWSVPSGDYAYQMRFDAQGRLWESDNGQGALWVFDTYGNVLNKFTLYTPEGFDFTLGGGFAFASQYGQAIDQYSPCSVATPTSTMTPLPAPCAGPQKSFSIGGYPNYTYGLGVDSQGNIYLSEADYGQIAVFQPNGTLSRTLGNSLNLNGRQIVMDNTRQLIYVGDANTNSVFVLHLSGSAAATIGQGIIGQIQGMALDGLGDIYVTDYSKTRVEEFNLSTGALVETFGSGGGFLGQFSRIGGIAVEPSTGDVYVGDAQYSRINVYTPQGRYLRGWQLPSSPFGNNPIELRFDGQGRLWELDEASSSLEVFDDYGNILGAFGGLSVYGPSGLAGQMSNPYGFDFMADGGFAVADGGNFRVDTYPSCESTPGITPTPVPTPIAGPVVLRFDVGSNQSNTDPSGNLWIADQAFGAQGYGYTQGGTAVTATGSVGGTQDPSLYLTYRKGSSLAYQFNLAPGTYQVTLKFADFISREPGQNIFDVVANGTAGAGTTVIKPLDVYATVGGSYALDRTFLVNVISGSPLTLQLNATTGSAILSALQIEGLQPSAQSDIYLYQPVGSVLVP